MRQLFRRASQFESHKGDSGTNGYAGIPHPNQYSISSMDSNADREDPNAEYSRRLEAHRLKQSYYEHRHKQLGIAKLVIAFTALIVVAWALKSRAVAIVWLLVPVLAFVLMETLHVRVLRSLQKCSRIIAFCERGLAPLEHHWRAAGDTGDRSLPPTHPHSLAPALFRTS